ncbi:hypothetical protein [Candidatus Poriferisodalis sp.]|uniref:hypothetical protein n=1 Tax=Candidatus Poriferisodalis sp. TaxID=3101277 RepID=UPI003B5B3960
MRPVGPGEPPGGEAERPEESADRHTKAMIKLDPVSRYESLIGILGYEPLGQYRPLYDSHSGEQIGVTQVAPVLVTRVQGRYEGEIDFEGDVDWIRFDAIPFAVYEIRVFRPSTASYGALKPRFQTETTDGNTEAHPVVRLMHPQRGLLSVWDDLSGSYVAPDPDSAEDRFVYSPVTDPGPDGRIPVFVSVEGGDGMTLACPSPRPCDVFTEGVTVYNTRTQVGEYVVTVRELDRSDVADDAECRSYPSVGIDLIGDGLVPSGSNLVGLGRINYPADRDCHTLILRRGIDFNETVRVKLLGSSLGHGTLPDPVILGIYRDGEEISGSDDDNGGYFRNSEVTFTTAGNPEEYQILVGGHCPHWEEASDPGFNICRRNVGTYRMEIEIVD